MVDINDYVRGGSLKVIVRPGKRRNSIAGHDQVRKAVIIDIKEQAHDNKANLELIRFLAKELRKEVRIKSGIKSKEKILSIN